MYRWQHAKEVCSVTRSETPPIPPERDSRCDVNSPLSFNSVNRSVGSDENVGLIGGINFVKFPPPLRSFAWREDCSVHLYRMLGLID